VTNRDHRDGAPTHVRLTPITAQSSHSTRLMRERLPAPGKAAEAISKKFKDNEN
jgi:hypothetical protein